MNMKINHIVISTLAMLVMSCGTRKAEQFQALPFPDVALPEMLQDPMDRAEYKAEHWWDRLTDEERTYPSDSALVSGVSREAVEQNFANWVNILSMIDYVPASKSVRRLYDRSVKCELKDTSSNVFETFTDLVEKYLYDPNSPLRNEDLYGPYAECLSRCEFIDEGKRQAYKFDARMCALNRIGTKAADFRFEDRNGRVRRLHEVKAEFTVLFFSNPGCEACMEIINALKNTPQITSLISSGKVAVLNIYIDEDLEAWRSYMPIYPEEWFNGFDPDFVIRTDVLYNVRAIPSLYLLDKDKNVIMKDAVTERVLDFFSRFVEQ